MILLSVQEKFPFLLCANDGKILTDMVSSVCEAQNHINLSYCTSSKRHPHLSVNLCHTYVFSYHFLPVPIFICSLQLTLIDPPTNTTCSFFIYVLTCWLRVQQISHLSHRCYKNFMFKNWQTLQIFRK